MKKCGSHFDLAMAIGVLQQENCIRVNNLHEYGLIGELALDGGLRACRGILPMIITAQKNGYKKEVHPVDFFSTADQKNSLKSSVEIRGMVERARQIQQERYAGEEGINCNAQMSTSMIQA